MTMLRPVISLHGINTNGRWQKDLAPSLARAGFIPVALDYGYFAPHRLLLPWSLKRQTQWLVGEYDRIVHEYSNPRPSVVAHSFGTLQVASLLQKHSHVQLDKLILCGSIVPSDFDWRPFLDSGRVSWIENDYGHSDPWPRVAKWLVPHAGDSGANGFTIAAHGMHQVRNAQYAHSDCFTLGHMQRHWLPTLLTDKRTALDIMDWLRRDFARLHGLKTDRVRTLLMRVDPTTNYLRVLPGLTLGDVLASEAMLALRTDAYLHTAGPAAALQAGTWHIVSANEYAPIRDGIADGKVHPSLQYTISIPLGGASNTPPNSVLVIDGFDNPSDLQSALVDLIPLDVWGEQLAALAALLK